MIKLYMIISVICFIFLFPAHAYPRQQEYGSVIEYISETHRLWGISECTLNNDGGITLYDSVDWGYGHALSMVDKNGNFIETITLNPGESCALIDDHARITYKFMGLENGKIRMDVTDEFDARSLGGKLNKTQKQLLIIPYNEAP